MKVIAKPIEMLAWYESDGTLNPVRFKITNKDGSESLINIDKIVKRSREWLAGNTMLIYDCIGVVADKERSFQLKFEICTCKWILFKI